MASDDGDAQDDAGGMERGEASAGSLSERLRAIKLREAGQADPAAVERALAAKATLSQRMRELMTSPPGEEPVSAPLRSRSQSSLGDAGDEAPLDEEAAHDFALRIQRIAARPAADEGPRDVVPEVSHPEPAAPPDRKRRLADWFLGREVQEVGRGAITHIPPFDRREWEEVEAYALEPPFAFVRILRQRATGEMRYEAIEPQLTDAERQVLEFVQDALVRGLNVDPTQLKLQERLDYLLGAVRQIVHDYRIRLDTVSQARVEYYLRRDFIGLGAIHVLMLDPNIEDISCDGAAEGLFIFHRRFESIPTNVRFRSDAELDGFVIRLAQRSGKAISISDPILDAAMPDGSRLQATLGREVTQNGSTFTIRRFRPDPFTPIDLVRFGTMSSELLAWFWLIVQNGHSLIFSGGTASGKTTGLNAISQFIPHQAKVVSIEDTREVNLPHKNWIKSVTRSGSTAEGTGEIGMFELLKASLRQRPEYILVGEVRGIEATVAFQAMATGHTVYSTMHADSARSVVYRLENDPINIPRLVLQALDCIAIQVQTRVGGKRVRRIKEVVELVGMDPATKELLTNTVFRWDPATDRFEYAGRSYLLDRIARERNWSREQVAAEFRRRQRTLDLMGDRGVRDVGAITELIKAYYRDPDALERALADEGDGAGQRPGEPGKHPGDARAAGNPQPAAGPPVPGAAAVPTRGDGGR